MILTVHTCDWAVCLVSHHLSFCLHLWDCLLHLWFAHLNNAPAQFTNLVSAMMIATLFPSHSMSFYPCPSPCLAVSLSVFTSLIPAWAQLKQFSCPSAHELWRQLVACEKPVRGLHYAVLKKTLFDLTRFYFAGAKLKEFPPLTLPRPLFLFPLSS